MIGMKAIEASVSFVVVRQLNDRNASGDQALITIEDNLTINRKRQASRHIL